MKSFLPGRPLTAGWATEGGCAISGEGAPSRGRAAGTPEKGLVLSSGSRGVAQARALATEQLGVARHFIHRAKPGLRACLQCRISISIGYCLSSLKDAVKVCLCKGQGFQMTVQWRGRTCQKRQEAASCYLFSLHFNRLL